MPFYPMWRNKFPLRCYRGPAMAVPKFKALGTSITSPLNNTERNEILVSSQKYGQILDTTVLPDLWLPWGRTNTVTVQCRSLSESRIERLVETDFTDAFMTLQPQLLSYRYTVDPRWSVEETISVAEALPDKEERFEEHETANGENAVTPAPVPIFDPYHVQHGDTLGRVNN